MSPPPDPPLPPEPPSPSHPSRFFTELLFEFPESYSKFPLAGYFTYGTVNFHVTVSIHLPFPWAMSEQKARCAHGHSGKGFPAHCWSSALLWQACFPTTASGPRTSSLQESGLCWAEGHLKQARCPIWGPVKRRAAFGCPHTLSKASSGRGAAIFQGAQTLVSPGNLHPCSW